MTNHLQEYTLPVDNNGDLFPEGCRSIQKLYIPSSFKDMEAISSRYGLPIYEYIVDPENPVFKSIDGVLYSKDGKTLVAFPKKDEDFSFSVPDEVEVIYEEAFDKQENLVSIEFPNGLKEIQGNSFNFCRKLKSFSLPSSVEVYDPIALWHTDALEEFVVAPDNSCYVAVDGVLFTKDMKELIHFPDAKRVDTYVIPASVDYIGCMAFLACSHVKAVDFSNVSTIAMRAFEESSISAVTFSQKLRRIDWCAFHKCNNLLELDWPQNLEIDEDTDCIFYQCEKLEKIHNFPEEMYIRMFRSDKYLSKHGLGTHFTNRNLLGTPFYKVIANKKKELKEQGLL